MTMNLLLILGGLALASALLLLIMRALRGSRPRAAPADHPSEQDPSSRNELPRSPAPGHAMATTPASPQDGVNCLAEVATQAPHGQQKPVADEEGFLIAGQTAEGASKPLPADILRAATECNVADARAVGADSPSYSAMAGPSVPGPHAVAAAQSQAEDASGLTASDEVASAKSCDERGPSVELPSETAGEGDEGLAQLGETTVAAGDPSGATDGGVDARDDTTDKATSGRPLQSAGGDETSAPSAIAGAPSPVATAATLTSQGDAGIPRGGNESRDGEGPVDAAGVGAPPVDQVEAIGSSPEAGKQPPKRARVPREYRPTPRTPLTPRAAGPGSEERAARDRSLPIEVRLVFEQGGFCRVSLLPRRDPALPGELAVLGSGDPPEMITLQDEWYQDVVLPDTGALLRRGIEWAGTLSDGRIVRWSLSGREMYVLCRHGDLNGFVSTPRLILGEQHVVLCTTERLQEVIRAIELTGSPDPATLDGASGMPLGWIGLRGVVPRTPVPPSPLGDILDALRPLAEVEIVLEGGIRLERLTWLSGYPPCIRLRGDVGSIGTVLIDGQEATLSPDGGYVLPGWDRPGQHVVWCASASRSYSIREGAEDWEAWDAYTWSMGNSRANGERSRPAICGVLVRPPRVAPKESRAVVVRASNPILLGSVPGQIHTCGVRGDVRAASCAGFPWFDPVWAIPADALHCDKRVARVLLIGDPRPVVGQETPLRAGVLKRPPRERREHARSTEAWCSAILTAGRKGLRTEPPEADVAALWQEYKRRAKVIWRGLR